MDVILTIAGYFAILNILGLSLMGIDKWKARKGAFRIPEATLFIIAIIGGSVGSILGMYIFRHKLVLCLGYARHSGTAAFICLSSDPFLADFSDHVMGIPCYLLTIEKRRGERCIVMRNRKHNLRTFYYHE